MAIYRRIPGGPGDVGRYLFEGGSGDDVLIGTWQNEILVGKSGSDVLIGGGGIDYFVVDSPFEVDHIKDFEVGEKILITTSAFGLPPFSGDYYARFSLDTQAGTLSFDGQVIATGISDQASTPMTLQDVVVFVEDPSDLIAGNAELM